MLDNEFIIVTISWLCLNPKILIASCKEKESNMRTFIAHAIIIIVDVINKTIALWVCWSSHKS